MLDLYEKEIRARINYSVFQLNYAPPPTPTSRPKYHNVLSLQWR
jgi:hypothetical protein